jgi:hypothetical protein
VYRVDESNPHLKEGDARSHLLDAAKAILGNPAGTGSLREAGLLLEAAIQVRILKSINDIFRTQF